MFHHDISTFRNETGDHPCAVGIKFNGGLDRVDAEAPGRCQVELSLASAMRDVP